jgi:hypothetical protein
MRRKYLINYLVMADTRILFSGYQERHLQREGMYGSVEQMKLTARSSQEQYLPRHFSSLIFP